MKTFISIVTLGLLGCGRPAESPATEQKESDAATSSAVVTDRSQSDAVDEAAQEKLASALVDVWGGARGTQAAFEAALLEAHLFVPAKGDIPLEQGALYAHTDRASFGLAHAGMEPRAVRSVDLLKEASSKGMGVFLHAKDHSFFTMLQPEDVAKLAARAQ